MAYQLVYTSAPKGLKPGAFGFCVVACTRGMKDYTASSLEALSGYRRVFTEQDATNRNPVAYSHVLYETSAGRLRILSRVADAGLDYSGRTNKLASFLDVPFSELVSPGPAALFAHRGLFCEAWTATDVPRYIETPVTLPNVVPIPSGLQEWFKITKDERWGTVLASTVAARRAVTLVVTPEQNVLRLFQEAIALLDPKDRWNATFSTYYMKAPPGVTCQWKAVMAGSPEERTLRMTPGALTLDLTGRTPLPTLEPLLETPHARALLAKHAAPPKLVPPISTTLPGATPEGDASATSTSVPGSALNIDASNIPFDLEREFFSGNPGKKGKRKKELIYGRQIALPVKMPKLKGDAATKIAISLAIYVSLAIMAVGVCYFIFTKSGAYDSFKGYINNIPKGASPVTENAETETPPVPELPDAGNNVDDGTTKAIVAQDEELQVEKGPWDEDKDNTFSEETSGGGDPFGVSKQGNASPVATAENPTTPPQTDAAVVPDAADVAGNKGVGASASSQNTSNVAQNPVTNPATPAETNAADDVGNATTTQQTASNAPPKPTRNSETSVAETKGVDSPASQQTASNATPRPTSTPDGAAAGGKGGKGATSSQVAANTDKPSAESGRDEEGAPNAGKTTVPTPEKTSGPLFVSFDDWSWSVEELEKDLAHIADERWSKLLFNEIENFFDLNERGVVKISLTYFNEKGEQLKADVEIDSGAFRARSNETKQSEWNTPSLPQPTRIPPPLNPFFDNDKDGVPEAGLELNFENEIAVFRISDQKLKPAILTSGRLEVEAFKNAVDKKSAYHYSASLIQLRQDNVSADSLDFSWLQKILGRKNNLSLSNGSLNGSLVIRYAMDAKENKNSGNRFEELPPEWAQKKTIKGKDKSVFLRYVSGNGATARQFVLQCAFVKNHKGGASTISLDSGNCQWYYFDGTTQSKPTEVDGSIVFDVYYRAARGQSDDELPKIGRLNVSPF